jgi:hypothetical protein
MIGRSFSDDLWRWKTMEPDQTRAKRGDARPILPWEVGVSLILFCLAWIGTSTYDLDRSIRHGLELSWFVHYAGQASLAVFGAMLAVSVIRRARLFGKFLGLGVLVANGYLVWVFFSGAIHRSFG